MTPLERITVRVTRNGHPDDSGTPIPLLTLEEFFEGNEVDGSICCNLDSCPPPAQVFHALKAIRERNEVADVRVQVTAFDDPEWPFSDTVWIMTKANSEEVASWIPDELAPDECWEGWIESQVYEAYDVPADTHPVAMWWD